MFLGGILPGMVLITAVIVFGILFSIKTKIPLERFDLKKALLALKDSIFEILLPFFLIGGYFSGILSLIEIGAAAVIYVFIVEVFIHREIKLKDVPRVFSKAVPIIGGVLSILALSQALYFYIIFIQAPQNFAYWMESTIESRHLFLLLLNLSLLVIGSIMEIFSAISVIFPLIIELGKAYEINPVHLGIIFITNMEVGFITPPVGMNLFLAAYCFKKPFATICRYVFPFLFIQVVVVILVTYIPWFSTILVQIFGARVLGG
jgi:tripartite ATP-independent transporter DctM subunit